MKMAWIYMDSGFGSRFGENKLLVELGGKPLYRHGLDCLLQAMERVETEMEGWQVQLIVVSQYREILETAAALGAEPVMNPQSGEGIAASLRFGTEAARDAQILVYCVADQPGMRPESFVDFLKGFAESGKGMGCVCSGGRRGNPAAFRADYREELLKLTGDRGGSRLLKRFPEDVWQWSVEERELQDVDLPEDLRQWKE